MIKFEQVYKDYPVSGNRLRALHPTDLAITAGEVFGLVGHSGAGKSTLLRLINRLEAPSGGRVWVDGQEITALDSRALRRFRQQVGMIFQHFNLLSSKTVAQNIALPLQLAGMRDPATIARRVDELLARVAIADQADKYPAQLSGGQKQRVGIARALALKPKILLCDEATSALDPQTTVQVLRLLREINLELGLTIVLITHEMDVIRRVCDRVAVMDGGRVVEQGEVMQVFLHPQHPTTQRFVRENEHLDEDSLHNDFAQVEGRILRLTFQGEATYAPTLSQLASATGVQYSILAGRIDRIQNRPCGQLTVALRGDNLAAALAWLDKADLHLEILR